MMLQSSSSFSKLLAELKKLPGVGERTALRLAFHLLKSPAKAASLADALAEAVTRVGFCSTCFAITEEDPCRICAGDRDRTKICVVEQPQDLLALERTHAFGGLYHVLQGALSPVNGVTPADLRIEPLLERLRDGTVNEVVLATNFSVEGEATALYLSRLIRPLGIRTTRLAHGIPLGSDLEFVDAATVQRALLGRNEV